MGVRFRSTVAAVLVVAVGLLAGAVALVVLLRAELTDDVRQAARARAEQVAAVIESGRGVPSLAVAERDEQFIQVLDANGALLASSGNVEELPVLARPEKDGEARVTTPLDEDEFLVVAATADGPDGRKTVLVGRALLAVAESTRIVTRLLLLGLPLLLLLAAAATWMAVGRALAPVAAMRAEVEAISATELQRRVPLPRGRDEIARLAVTMNRMLDRLERAQTAQRRFISDASHELRSPVASVRQHAEVALAHPGRSTQEELAATVLAENLRIQRLVDDLLLLARADEDALRPRRQTVDLDDLVLDEARRLRAAAPALRISTAGVSAARLQTDAQGLRRVLRNLGDNAARHARERVAFGLTREEDGRTVLLVEDDGPGVPPADRERIFERFVRLDDARARSGKGGGGSGLGLAIVAELVAAHGGTATVGESPLGGARFEVWLPRG
ncbi:sensor histidine kinase [Streptomyces sp. H27-D2]|uniref:sensor histidine kinase n=1 Tax=Streptomyces sp. H27-D2 TaxID=3046304 RepID=UPI002DB9AEB9|nr:ATP-binding protein [Streptomyces sp. H27-D2]MEC4017560.1 ATP-binding protein [Streptomyces sp. H27-D2]